ncbi:hypothetical protein CCP3SC1AL1_1650003 [Gammaproteobacteria bacterium]
MNYPQQSAQGLASLGRNGDSVLVHMNPTEVAGLQSLAMAQGGSLTINPDTGLPEAFSLGNFFKSLLPMIAGAAMPASAGLWAGIAAGAATGALTNKDKLMGAITGGLGGYGGFNIGQGLRAAAGNAAGNVASNIVPQGVAESTVGGAGNLGMFSGTTADSTMAGVGDLSQFGSAGQYGSQAATTITDPTILNSQNAAQTMRAAGAGPGSSILNSAASPAEQALSNFGSNASQLKQGFGNVFSGDQAAIDAYTKGIGAKTGTGALIQTAMPIGGAALGGVEPSDLYGNPINMDEAKKKQAYDPYSSLNLSGDTGLRLYAIGGPIEATAGSSVYGNPDGTIAQQTPKDDYGIGRLNNLARQQSQTQAQTYGYAMGGPVSFADGGDSNKEDAMGLPSLSPDMSINPNTGPNNSAMLQSIMGAMQPMQGMQGSTTAQSQMPDQSNDSLIAKVTANLKADPNYQPTNPIEASIVKQIKGTDQMQQGQPSQQGLGSLTPSQPMTPSYNPSVAMGPTYFAGINAPRGMARGGYLDGQGDGMSDSIPATIEGKQPARLADGEFVVPADVVSHIGNGSSKAGSKRLYAMLNKVRQARTGRVKQGKQINPNKYMPA